MSAIALRFDDVSMVYRRSGASSRPVLDGVSLEVAAGETLSIMGRSGSGKSTLLNLAAGIDVPTSGEVDVLGQRLSTLSDRRRTMLRRQGIGMVFQFFHLLPHLSVLENVLLPGLIAGVPGAELRRRGRELLAQVDLADRVAENVQVLSGGEMQRVAICRALLCRPRLLLADEPTGNLDDATGRKVLNLLLALAAASGTTLVYVTHDAQLAGFARTRLAIHSGRIEPA